MSLFAFRRSAVMTSSTPEPLVSLDDLNFNHEKDITLKSEADENGVTTHWHFSVPASTALSVSFKRAVLRQSDAEIAENLKNNPS